MAEALVTRRMEYGCPPENQPRVVLQQGKVAIICSAWLGPEQVQWLVDTLPRVLREARSEQRKLDEQ